MMTTLGVPTTRFTTTLAEAARFRRSRPETTSVFAPLVSGTSMTVKLPLVSLARTNCAVVVPMAMVAGSRLVYVRLTVTSGVPVVVGAGGGLLLLVGGAGEET